MIPENSYRECFTTAFLSVGMRFMFQRPTTGSNHTENKGHEPRGKFYWKGRLE
jgi:hypothetical protein